MKKFAITTFVLLYTGLIFWLPAERTDAWVSHLVSASTNTDSSRHSHGFGKTEKSDAHVSQTKLVETEFVVESPRKAIAAPVHSELFVWLTSFPYQSKPICSPLSSRAPPVLI
jgi:hypothetical protein